MEDTSHRSRLNSLQCPYCGMKIDSEEYEPTKKGAAPTAKTYDDCLRKCEPCEIGFSNTSSQDPKKITLIFKDPLKNLPSEVRENAKETLENGINVLNHKSKLNSFCSENSEDAVTWTFFSYLAKDKQLNKTLKKIGVKIPESVNCEPKLLLWGVPIDFHNDFNVNLSQKLITVLNAIGESENSRTEPDVILDFGEHGVVFIEVKFKSGNTVKQKNYKGWDRYLNNTDAFQNYETAKDSGMYELVRNWRVGLDYANGRPFTFINLGIESLFKASTKKLDLFKDSLKKNDQCNFIVLEWSKFIHAIDEKPSWLLRYDSHHGLSSQRRDLVRPIEEEISVESCISILKEALIFLAEAGKNAISTFSTPTNLSWGSNIKRLAVQLPRAERPYLIPGKIDRHNFIEVANQCATMERLIDALNWVNENQDFNEYKVKSCNPTTSSSKSNSSKKNDRDLILIKGDNRCFFEVSDVVGTKDSNKKELKDLISLGAVSGTIKNSSPAQKFPDEKLFLVCSSNFAETISKKKNKKGRLKGIYYEKQVGTPSNSFTTILRVLREGNP